MLASDLRGRRVKESAIERVGLLLAGPALPSGLCDCLCGNRWKWWGVWMAGPIQASRRRNCCWLLPQVSIHTENIGISMTDLDSGYGCANINGQTCTLVVTSSTIPTVTCDGSKSQNFGFQTVPDPEASITAFSMFAPMVQINWQSSDRPATTTSSTGTGSTAPSTRPTTSNPLASASGTKVIDTEDESAEETLVLDDNSQATGTGRVPTRTLGAPGLASDAADASSDEDSEGLSSNLKVGLGVVGASVVLLALVIGLFWCWRKRKNAAEEQELDRLYGQKTATGSTSDLTRSDEIPGWCRGQRLATPKPFFRESLREMRMPAEPYQHGGSPYFRDPGYRV